MKNLLLGVCSVAAGVSAMAAEKAERMNVLFIAADDLRNDLGCMGNAEVKSPNIDQLAARGVAFRNAYCQQALCNPSRASLMTGRRPSSLGMWSLQAHFRDNFPDIVTMPQAFRAGGYEAVGIGKIYHNSGKAAGDEVSWSKAPVMQVASHYMDVPLPPGKEGVGEQDRSIKTSCNDVPDEAYFDGRIARLAVAELERLKKEGKPFFLGVGFWKPHLPYNAPKKYWDLYERSKIAPADPADWPAGAPRVAWHNGQELLGKENPQQPSAEFAAELRHGYYAGISYMDAQVGKVLDALERLGLAENTIVVFWSDNGFHLGELTLWCKTSNFERDARVPLVISVPGKKWARGGVCEVPVELLDLYPTLAKLCGVEAPKGLEGKDISGLVEVPSAEMDLAAFTQAARPGYFTKKQPEPETMGYSVRLKDSRYTEWRDFKTGKVEATEFYDYSKAGKGERVNVAGLAEYKEKVEKARGVLGEEFPVKGK